MKYLSIDLETTGLNDVNHQILTFSAILEDTDKNLAFDECPKLNIYLLRSEIVGSPFAINMNAQIIASISRYQTLKTIEEKRGFATSLHGIFLDPVYVSSYFYVWNLVYHEDKNYKYLLDSERWEDKRAAEASMKEISELRETFGPITVNVAGKNFATFDKKFIDRIEKFYHFVRFRQRVLDPSTFFVDWSKDTAMPDLSTCKERAGLDSFVSHQSLDDAWDVISLFRKAQEISRVMSTK